MRGTAIADSQRFVEFVGEAYGFDGLDEFRAGLIELLARAIPSDWISYNEVHEDPSDTVVLVTPRLSSEQLQKFARLSHENPILNEIRRTGDGRPRRFSDLIDRRSLHALDLYREFYGPLGVETQVAFTLPALPPRVIGVAMCRGIENYSDEEVDFLARARPHLIQAYRNAELASARSAALKTLEGGLESLGHDLVLVDRSGRIELATGGARHALSNLDDGEIDNGGGGGSGEEMLPSKLRDWLAHQRSNRSRATPLVLDTGDGGTLLLRLLPARAEDNRDILLLEHGERELTVPSLCALGLTTREAETLRWAALGQSAADTARLMGVARRTVDKHQQRIYAKLRVSSRTDAAAVAWAAAGVGPAR